MPRASAIRIIRNDLPSFLLLIVGPLFIGVCLFRAVFGGPAGAVDPVFARFMLWVSGAVTVAMLGLLVLRIGRIRRVLDRGPRVTATVTGVSFIRDRGRVTLTWEHEGRPRETTQAIMKNERTQALTAGESIEIALHPEKPDKALIVGLYEADPE